MNEQERKGCVGCLMVLGLGIIGWILVVGAILLIIGAIKG